MFHDGGVWKREIVHTSDLEGVQLEDYRDALIDEKADVFVIDGPATYLYGFMINRINLTRAVENLSEIVRKADAEQIILDHHLSREPRYRERLEKVYETAKKEGKSVITTAEYLGRKPKIIEINKASK